MVHNIRYRMEDPPEILNAPARQFTVKLRYEEVGLGSSSVSVDGDNRPGYNFLISGEVTDRF
jgi:hypothetical protein